MGPQNTSLMKDRLPSQLAVVGLGYVGLQVAAAFGRVLPTVGFDLDGQRIEELKRGYDRNREVPAEILRSTCVDFSSCTDSLSKAQFIIIAVPTQIDKTRRPDLSHLIEASNLVGRAVKSNNQKRETGHLKPEATDQAPIVVYESTVYPGCTEEVCIPVLERASGLKSGRDFKVGYSPERINPGDSQHTLENVVKIVAAQDPKTLGKVAQVYGLVVKAGIYSAPDIRTAEAAKVIENVQRDLNIALVNELSMLFHCLDIETREVLKAAATKWNFLHFEPGLVGGHCIPVDPYYLTNKAQEAGCDTGLILAGRSVNDNMGAYIAHETVKLLTKAGKAPHGAKALVLGLTFKENVRDVRNTQVVSLVRELESYGVKVQVYDPLVEMECIRALGLAPLTVHLSDRFERPVGLIENDHRSRARYDALILAVPHDVLRRKTLSEYLALLDTENNSGVLVDVKGVLPWPGDGYPRVLYWSL